MMTTMYRTLAAVPLVAALGLTLAPSPCFAQDDASTRQAASNRFNRGIELYEEGDFSAALVEFNRAYDLSPNYRVLYNIALAQYQLGDYAGALESLERYLEDGGSEIGAEKRASVQKELAKMRDRVGTITIVVPEEGASITVDGRDLGTTPLGGPVRVSIGRREIVVSKDGRRVTKRVEVATGDDLRVELDLPEATDAPVPTPTPDPKGTEPDPNYVPAGVLWGFAGAGAIASVVTGVLALGASSDLEELRTTFGTTQAEREDQQATVTRLGVVTDVLWVTSAVLGVMALTFTIVPPDRSGGESEEESAGLDALDLRVGPTGVTLQGSF